VPTRRAPVIVVIRPVLERLREADAVVLGSPVYFSQPLEQVRSFVEKWLFPVYSYHYEDGKPRLCRDRPVPCGMVYTMNLPEGMYESWGYKEALKHTPESMGYMMGCCETLNIFNTYQFRDYSRYDANLFDEEEKRAYRDSHFEIDMRNAYELGRRVAERAKRIAKGRDFMARSLRRFLSSAGAAPYHGLSPSSRWRLNIQSISERPTWPPQARWTYVTPLHSALMPVSLKPFRS
jgi:multimeric flavodoxin WrbA